MLIPKKEHLPEMIYLFAFSVFVFWVSQHESTIKFVNIWTFFVLGFIVFVIRCYKREENQDEK